jgi:hypothetical protein
MVVILVRARDLAKARFADFGNALRLAAQYVFARPYCG